MKRRLVAFAIFITVLACAPGNAADDVAQTRTVPSFDRVRLQGAFAADILAGASRTTVAVTADRDTLSRVTTEVHDRTLIVGMRPGDNSLPRTPKVSIVLPSLRSVSIEGAGSAKIGGLTGGNLVLATAGAASIVASGRAAREDISLNGAGNINATAVDAHDVIVDNNGVGTVNVRASGLLTMNVNGVGSIRYSGSPTHVESHISGIGSVHRL